MSVEGRFWYGGKQSEGLIQQINNVRASRGEVTDFAELYSIQSGK